MGSVALALSSFFSGLLPPIRLPAGVTAHRIRLNRLNRHAPKVIGDGRAAGGAASCATARGDGAMPIHRASQHTTVRVIRIAEGSQDRSLTGRLVISGRIADVCAELERLDAKGSMPR